MIKLLRTLLLMLIGIIIPFTLPAQTPGSLKWTFAVDDAVESSPAIGPDGTIYFGSYDTKLYALNPNGSQKWSFQTDAEIFTSPAIGMDGTIYFGSDDACLYAINPDGSEKWRYQTGDFILSSPALAPDGTTYIGSFDFNFYAINPDGSEKWVLELPDFVLSSPAVGSDGTIYVSSADGYLMAIQPDGTIKWQFPIGEWIFITLNWISSSPAIGQDGTIYIGSEYGMLYAINPNGTQKWVFEAADLVHSSPAIGADGTVYFGCDNGSFHAVHADGRQKWVFEINDAIYSSPAVGDDGTIYVGAGDKKFYAINPDGSQQWVYTTQAYVNSSPTIDRNGAVYVGGSDNKFYAFHSSSSGLADSPWPKFRRGLRNDGCLLSDFFISDETEFSLIQPGETVNHTIAFYNSFSKDITVIDLIFCNSTFTSSVSMPMVVAAESQKLFTCSIAADQTGLYQSNCKVTYTKGVKSDTISHMLNGAGIFIEDDSETGVVARRALAAYQACRAKDGSSPATLNNLGILYRLLDESSLAEQTISKALSKSLNLQYGYGGIKMNMGVIKSDRMQTEDAYTFYGDAMDDVSVLSPIAAQIHYNRAWQAYSADSLTAALDRVEAALGITSLNNFIKAKALVLRGAIRYRLGQEDAAKNDFQGAQSLDSDGPIGRLAQENLDALETGVTDLPSVLPADFALLPNYPNPFNPSTCIRYALPHPAHLNITVYNLRGQQIKNIISSMQSAGWHEILWDGRDDSGLQVGSGVYMLRAQSGEWREVRKITLVK